MGSLIACFVFVFYWLFRRKKAINLDGKTILITGVDAGNLGHHLAIQCSKRGAYRLVLVYFPKSSASNVKKIGKDLESSSDTLVEIRCKDLASESDRNDLLDEFDTSVDVVFLGHVVSRLQNCLSEGAPSNLKREMDINFHSCVEMTHRLILKQPSVRVAVISSFSTWIPVKGRSSYASSKAALNAWFGTLQLENPDTKCQIFLCGTILSPVIKQNFSQQAQKAMMPIEPEDAAAVIVDHDDKVMVWVGRGLDGLLAHLIYLLFPYTWFKLSDVFVPLTIKEEEDNKRK